MNKIILCFALLLFACTFASAETSVWKAQKGKSVIYLGGTCHILRDSDYPLPPEFERAYKNSQVVVFETDIAAFNDPSTQRKLLAKAVYSDGSTIQQHLSPQTYQELNDYFEENGIPLEAFSRFKPSMLMVTLTLMEFMKQGVTQKGVDVFFHDMAKKDGKKIEGLETVDEQLHYVITMADGNEDEFVSYSLKDMRQIEEKFDTLAEAWRKGDEKTLYQLMAGELKPRMPKLYGTLFTERNRNWLPAIDAYAGTTRTEFILVGVGHLVGPDGIIETLKNKGYRVDKM